MSSGWMTGNERSFDWLVKTCTWIALNIGRRSSHLFLHVFTFYFWIFSRRSKRASLDYLSRALGRPAKLVDVFRHFHTFGSVLLDRMFMKGWEKNLSIKIHGESVLREIHKKGGGCLLFGSHLGSFEIVRMLGVRQDGYSIKALMYAENEANSSSMFYKMNPEVAKTVITMGNSFSLLKVKELADEGCMTAILADRVFNDKKVTRCRFFGDSASFPTGPFIMAGALKIPVVLFFGLYRGGNRYDIYFEKLADCVVLNRFRRDRDIHDWVQRYADRLEHYARMAPFNWFNFYDFWGDRG